MSKREREREYQEKGRRCKEEMKEEGQFPSSLIQFPNNLLTQVLYQTCFERRVVSLVSLSARNTGRIRHQVYLVEER